MKSRYKTATYRHRPPVEKKLPEEASFPSKCRLLPKKVTISKRTPLTTPVNEDNITTLIQIEDDKDKRDVVRVQDGDGGKASEVRLFSLGAARWRGIRYSDRRVAVCLGV